MNLCWAYSFSTSLNKSVTLSSTNLRCLYENDLPYMVFKHSKPWKSHSFIVISAEHDTVNTGQKNRNTINNRQLHFTAVHMLTIFFTELHKYGWLLNKTSLNCESNHKRYPLSYITVPRVMSLEMVQTRIILLHAHLIHCNCVQTQFKRTRRVALTRQNGRTDRVIPIYKKTQLCLQGE